MPWPKLMLLRILDQVYHIQIKAVAVNATQYTSCRTQQSMYTLSIYRAAWKVEGIGPTQIAQVEPVSQTPDKTGFRTGKPSKISLFSKWTRTMGRLWRLEMDPAEEENATRILRLCVIAVSFLPLNSSLLALNISHSRPICEKTKIVLHIKSPSPAS